MTKGKVWRYRCDYCKKAGLSAWHMEKHERSCTANPDRKCRMHEYYPDSAPLPVAQLVAALRKDLPDFGMDRLREISGGCPMCILAAIRQSGIAKYVEGETPVNIEFDFKGELKRAWVEIQHREY